MANYSREEWAEVKGARRQQQAQKRYENDPLYRLHMLLNAFAKDKRFAYALELIRAVEPKHEFFKKYPARKVKRVDNYARKKTVVSPKNNPVLVKDAKSITRTMLIPVEEFTGLDLSRATCETLGLEKIWTPYHTEDEVEWARRLGDHLETVWRAWMVAEKDVVLFVTMNTKVADPSHVVVSKEKEPPKYDAHGGALSLDVLTQWEVL